MISVRRARRGYGLVNKRRRDLALEGERAARRAGFAWPIILALSGLDAAGYSVIAPVLPRISEATGAGPAVIGALVATFPAGMLFGFVAAAPGIARGRTRTVLAASLLVIAAGCVGFVVADDLAVYFVARAVMGFGSGGLWMGVTFAALERSPGDEYAGMSRMLAAYSVGSVIGPALGALGGVRGPFAAYLILVLASVGLALLLPTPAQRKAFHPDRAALRVRGFWLSCGTVLFAVIALGIVEGVLPLHFDSRLGQAEIGALFVGLAFVLGGGAVLAGQLRPRVVVPSGVVLTVIGIAWVGIADSVPTWIAALAVTGIGFAFAETGSVGILLDAVGTERIVTAMIVWSQIGISGYLIGPLAGGGVAEGLSFAWIGVVPLAAAVALAVLALGLRPQAAATDASTAAARKGTR
jgi:MFS family permease